MLLEPICDQLPIHGAEMKSASMRWGRRWTSYGELKMLPLSSFRALASIFQWIEDHKQWPACLSQWFLVLLRKTNIAVPEVGWLAAHHGCSLIVSSVGASRILGVLKDRGAGMVTHHYHFGVLSLIFWITRTIEKPQSGKPINLPDPQLANFLV